MFVDNSFLALAILAVVGIAAILRERTGLAAIVAGAVLLVGCVLVLLATVARAALAGRRG